MDFRANWQRFRTSWEELGARWHGFGASWEGIRVEWKGYRTIWESQIGTASAHSERALELSGRTEKEKNKAVYTTLAAICKKNGY